MKEIRYDKFCHKCVNFGKEKAVTEHLMAPGDTSTYIDDLDACNECLTVDGQEGSVKPINFKEKAV